MMGRAVAIFLLCIYMYIHAADISSHDIMRHRYNRKTPTFTGLTLAI